MPTRMQRKGQVPEDPGLPKISFVNLRRLPDTSGFASNLTQGAPLPLPLFAGPIPTTPSTSRGPVRRDGGAENGFEILARGTPKIW